jgi:hypothetical protein
VDHGSGRSAGHQRLQAQLDDAGHDAERLIAGLSEEQGSRRPEAGSWSVSECLDHLATGNRVFLHAMQEPADRARAEGRASPPAGETRSARAVVRGIRFSLATGLHVITAHERRHLWRGWRVRQ